MNERTLLDKYYRMRSRYWRLRRLWFPSPAEMKFIELMGGKVWVSPIKSRKSGFYLSVVLSRGKLLRSEKFKREVRCGRYYMDMANDIKRGIEIDGKDFHQDVVAEFERESYLYQHGWRLLRIKAGDIYRQPDKIQRDVLKFLNS